MSIERAVTSFGRDDYSAAACPAGSQRWAASGIILRMILPPPPPTKPTVMALVASAQIQRKCFFFFPSSTDEQPTPRGLYLSHSRLFLPCPLFFWPLQFVVRAHFQNSLKREERGRWSWLRGMGSEEAERGGGRVKGEGLG